MGTMVKRVVFIYLLRAGLILTLSLVIAALSDAAANPGTVMTNPEMEHCTTIDPGTTQQGKTVSHPETRVAGLDCPICIPICLLDPTGSACLACLAICAATPV